MDISDDKQSEKRTGKQEIIKKISYQLSFVLLIQIKNFNMTLFRS